MASGGAGAGGSAGSGAGAAGKAGAAGASANGFPYELEFVGNITTGDAVDTDGKTYSRHWGQITPENAGKWGSVQSSAGAGFHCAPRRHLRLHGRAGSIFKSTLSSGVVITERTSTAA